MVLPGHNWRLFSLQGSYYLETSSVSGVSSQIVERIPYQTLPYGLCDDSGGGSTDKLLMYVASRFGPVASFSGTYRADGWVLRIQRTPIESSEYRCSYSVSQLKVVFCIVWLIHICVYAYQWCSQAMAECGSHHTSLNNIVGKFLLSFRKQCLIFAFLSTKLSISSLLPLQHFSHTNVQGLATLLMPITILFSEADPGFPRGGF